MLSRRDEAGFELALASYHEAAARVAGRLTHGDRLIFSIDAVARQADVARMTVYYQFGSRAGLLEALADDLPSRGHMERLPEAFQQPDPRDALMMFIERFGHFWAADGIVTRRLRGLAAVDPDFERVIRSRDERRRVGLGVLVRRLRERTGAPAPHAAGGERGPEDVVPLIQRLAQAALDLPVG